jgi:hypothetical protein
MRLPKRIQGRPIVNVIDNVSAENPVELLLEMIVTPINACRLDAMPP